MATAVDSRIAARHAQQSGMFVWAEPSRPASLGVIRRNKMLSWVGAIWLTAQIFDTVVDVGGSQTCSQHIFYIFDCDAPVFVVERTEFLQKGMRRLISDSALLTLSLMLFFITGTLLVLSLSTAPARSLGFLLAAAGAFLVYSDLFCVLGADVLLLLEKYAFCGATTIGLAFAYWVTTGSGLRLSLGAGLITRITSAYNLFYCGWGRSRVPHSRFQMAYIRRSASYLGCGPV